MLVVVVGGGALSASIFRPGGHMGGGGVTPVICGFPV